jgi:hypothetical protein
MEIDLAGRVISLSPSPSPPSLSRIASALWTVARHREGRKHTHGIFETGVYATMISHLQCFLPLTARVSYHIQWCAVLTKEIFWTIPLRLCLTRIPFACYDSSLMMFDGVVLAVLTGEAKVLIDDEFAEARVAGGENGESNDNTEGDQFGGNLSELSQTLGNSVRTLFFFRKTHHALRRHHPESSSGVHLKRFETRFSVKDVLVCDVWAKASILNCSKAITVSCI